MGCAAPAVYDLTPATVEGVPNFLRPFPPLLYKVWPEGARTTVQLFGLHEERPDRRLLGVVTIDEPFDRRAWDGFVTEPLSYALQIALAVHSGAAMGEDADGLPLCVHLFNALDPANGGPESLARELSEIAGRFRSDGSYAYPTEEELRSGRPSPDPP
jgi:hypothetical protein